MSVAMWVVNAVSSAAGTSARPHQASRLVHVGAPSAASGRDWAAVVCGSARRRTSAKQAPMRDDQHEVEHGPVAAHRRQPDRRLEQERIAEQGDEAAEIGGAVEEVRILRVVVAGAREPGLQQRRVGGDGDERQADRHGEETELPQGRIAERRLAPRLRAVRRAARSAPRGRAPRCTKPVDAGGT